MGKVKKPIFDYQTRKSFYSNNPTLVLSVCVPLTATSDVDLKKSEIKKEMLRLIDSFEEKLRDFPSG